LHQDVAQYINESMLLDEVSEIELYYWPRLLTTPANKNCVQISLRMIDGRRTRNLMLVYRLRHGRLNLFELMKTSPK
jgi:hypothetical protein